MKMSIGWQTKGCWGDQTWSDTLWASHTPELPVLDSAGSCKDPMIPISFSLSPGPRITASTSGTLLCSLARVYQDKGPRAAPPIYTTIYTTLQQGTAEHKALFLPLVPFLPLISLSIQTRLMYQLLIIMLHFLHPLHPEYQGMVHFDWYASTILILWFLTNLCVASMISHIIPYCFFSTSPHVLHKSQACTKCQIRSRVGGPNDKWCFSKHTQMCALLTVLKHY